MVVGIWPAGCRTNAPRKDCCCCCLQCKHIAMLLLVLPPLLLLPLLSVEHSLCFSTNQLATPMLV